MNLNPHHLNPHHMTKIRSAKIMASAKGSPCTTMLVSMIPGRRCGLADTTVCSHAPVPGKGKSTKVTDLATTYSCDQCHAIIEGVDKVGRDYLMERYPAAVLQQILNGLAWTQSMWIDSGLLIVPDGKLVNS